VPYFITLHRGPNADEADPVLALSDPAAVRAVLDAVRRLVASAEAAPPPLHLLGHNGTECGNTPSAAHSRGTMGEPR
jgi:hypothetical protein